MELKLITKKKIIDTNYVYETEEAFRKFLYKYMEECGKNTKETDYLGNIKIIVEIVED